jgi:hypothetical protein
MKHLAGHLVMTLLTTLFVVLPASAERPSLNKLNAEVNQLQAENEAQQAEIDTLRAGQPHVFDSDGQDLGTALGPPTSASEFLVLHASLGLVVHLDTANPSGLRMQRIGALYYEGLGCTGKRYAAPIFVNQVYRDPVSGNSRIGLLEMPATRAFLSAWVGDCLDIAISSSSISTSPFTDDLGYNLPLVEPLWIGPAP